MQKHSDQKTILLVDDAAENLMVLNAILCADYRLKAATDGEKGLRLARREPHPDLILLDIMMPGLNGYEVCRALKADQKTAGIPVIFVTGLGDVEDETKGFEEGAVDYIHKPFSLPIVKARVATHLALKCHRDHLEELVTERTKELELTRSATIESLATLAEYRDPETGGHIKRTQYYVKALADSLRHHPKFCDFLARDRMSERLYQSAPLHDIGKVGVRDHILLKPGKLTVEEFEEMKTHTIYGYQTLCATENKLGHQASFLSLAKEIAYGHHERWDGTGYPQGLQGEEIPISARLMAVADVYDALISKRVYKMPFPHGKACEIMKDGRGSHFDPDILDAFLAGQDGFRRIALQYADFAEERELLAQPVVLGNEEPNPHLS